MIKKETIETLEKKVKEGTDIGEILNLKEVYENAPFLLVWNKPSKLSGIINSCNETFKKLKKEYNKLEERYNYLLVGERVDTPKEINKRKLNFFNNYLKKVKKLNYDINYFLENYDTDVKNILSTAEYMRNSIELGDYINKLFLGLSAEQIKDNEKKESYNLGVSGNKHRSIYEAQFNISAQFKINNTSSIAGTINLKEKSISDEIKGVEKEEKETNYPLHNTKAKSEVDAFVTPFAMITYLLKEAYPSINNLALYSKNVYNDVIKMSAALNNRLVNDKF